jgi:hypothetical protein
LRDELARVVISMGHLPVDLTAARVFQDDPWETVDRHLQRTDYVVLLIVEGSGRTQDHERARRIIDRTIELSVPVLAFVTGPASGGTNGASPASPLLDRIANHPRASRELVDATGASMAPTLIRFIDTHERPGLTPRDAAIGTPTALAAEIARLVMGTGGLGREESVRIASPPPPPRETDWDALVRALHANRIHVPLWAAGASEWERPKEISLYDFFLRIAPELAVETSVADLAEFIPSGVCEMEADALTHRWLVPPHSLKLWLTDLMALGLLEPSNRKRSPKDTNEYWRLTPTGRELVSRVRRPVLEFGGHRHVGSTQEFPVVLPGDTVELRASS